MKALEVDGRHPGFFQHCLVLLDEDVLVAAATWIRDGREDHGLAVAHRGQPTISVHDTQQLEGEP